MIYIREDKTQKVPGPSALYVFTDSSFPAFHGIMKQCDGYYYHTKFQLYELPATFLSFVLDSLTSYDTIDLQLLEDDVNVPEPVEFITPFRTQPFDYQIDGIRFGLSHERWLLLDAPGLGKTLQATYIAQERKARAQVSHCLIICCVNSLKENWRREILKHSDLTCKILGEKVTRRGTRYIGSVKERLEDIKSNPEEFFWITNIETLRDPRIVAELNNPKHHIDMIISDEVHRCKSSQSKMGKAFLALTCGRYRIAATGTLIVNNPTDAFVPLKWIGAERGLWTNFQLYYLDKNESGIIYAYKHTDVLREMIDQNSLRRTKDILHLPPKIVIPEYVSMDDTQRIFYENVVNGVKEEVDKVELKTSNLLALTARLRQATACPSVLTTKEVPSAKIDRAVELVEDCVSSGEKIIVWSTFKETVQVLAQRLQQYAPLICTGDEKDAVINYRKQQFQEDDIHKVMLCTWQKMGTGHTLTRASTAVFIDTPFTSTDTEQAEDRIHRIGTNDSVNIYHLITADTVDERVEEIINDKAALADYLIDHKISRKGLESLRKFIEHI